MFEYEQRNEYTETLVDLDAKRDSIFIGIKHLLEGNTHHFNPTKQETAKRLFFSLHSYGKNIPRMNYQAETAVIDSMLSEWQTETTLQEAITLLQLSEWVTVLQRVNTQFNQQYLGRVSETAATEMPSFSSLRTDAKTVYRALVARIEAFKILEANELYTQLYHQIYELAKQYNLVVKLR